MNKDSMSTPDDHFRLAALEQKVESLAQRLASVEQMALLLAETEKNAITELQNLQQQQPVQSLSTHAASAADFRWCWKPLRKCTPQNSTVIFVAREYFGDNTKYAFSGFL